MSFRFPEDFPTVAQVQKTFDHPNRVVLNGQNYLFSCFIENGEQVKELEHEYINDFAIHDSLIGFTQSGHLTYFDRNFTVRSVLSKVNIALGDDCVEEQDQSELDPRLRDFSFRGCLLYTSPSPRD